MTPNKVLLDRLAVLLAGDTTTLAPAALAVHVHLSKGAFTPSQDNVIGDFVEADFDGYLELDAGVGPQQNFLQPATGFRVVQLEEPAGGWHWQASGVTNLPQSIYGFYVTDNADAVVYGSMLLNTPELLSGILDAVDLPWVRFSLTQDALV